MAILCWIPNQPNIFSYNGSSSLNPTLKSIMVNNHNFYSSPKVKLDNIEICSTQSGSFTLKTVALDSKDRFVTIAAYSEFNPITSSPSIQAYDTLKSINNFSNSLNMTLMPMGDMRSGIKIACKFDMLDLYNLYENMKKFNLLDPALTQGITNVGNVVGPLIIGTVNTFRDAQRLIMEVALGARDLINEISNILSFLSSAALIYDVGRLIAMISRWMAKRSEISRYERSGSYQRNAQRLEYANKIVNYLNNLEKDGKPLPKETQKDLIKFFSDDQKDIAGLWDVTNNLSKIAKNRTLMDKLGTAFGK